MSEEKKKSKKKRIYEISITTVLWLYIIVKLFIIDIDVLIVRKLLPQFEYLLNFKFIAILLILTFISIKYGYKKMIGYVLYFCFFPVIGMFWIAYFILKKRSWLLVIAVINSITMFFRSIKKSLLCFTMFVTSSTVILLSNIRILLILSVVVQISLIIWMYASKVISIFRQPCEIDFYDSVIKYYKDKRETSFVLNDEIRNIQRSDMNDAQIKQWTDKLQLAVITNRIFLVIATKFQEYKRSKINIVSYLMSIILLFLNTIIIFSLCNYGIFKLYPSAYDTISNVSLFTFIYYSFNTFLNSSVVEISPANQYSMALNMFIKFNGVVLLSLILAMFFQFKNQKYEDTFDRIISDFENIAVDCESIVTSEFCYTSIEDAIDELNRLKSTLINIIYALSNYLK